MENLHSRATSNTRSTQMPPTGNTCSILDLGGSTAPPHSLPVGLPDPGWGVGGLEPLEAVRRAVWPSESKWGVCPPTGAPSGAGTCELFQRGTGVRSHQPVTHAPCGAGGAGLGDTPTSTSGARQEGSTGLWWRLRCGATSRGSSSSGASNLLCARPREARPHGAEGSTPRWPVVGVRPCSSHELERQAGLLRGEP